MAKGRISTRGGDKGRTGVGGGGRVDKDDPRIECLGELDEANSVIGFLRSQLPPDHDWEPALRRIQTDLMNLMAHVATPSSESRRPSVPLPEEAAAWMEEWMQAIEDDLASATEYFLLPGGTAVSAACHLARTVSRRAERRLVTLHKQDALDPSILQFVNRLSDLFFKLARQEMHRAGITEDRWALLAPSRRREERDG